MSSGENWFTRLQDFGNPDGPKLRAHKRATKLAEAALEQRKAEQRLKDERERSEKLTPVEEQRQKNALAVEQETALLVPASKKADLDLATKARTDELNIEKLREEGQIQTANQLTLDKGLYENILGLIGEQGRQQTAARADYLGENAAVREWLSAEADKTRPGATEQFLDSLSKTAAILVGLSSTLA